jgi:hypothetical protein
LIADGACEAAIDYLFSSMTLSLDGYREALEKDREAGDIAHQRFTHTQYPFRTVDADTITMIRRMWQRSFWDWPGFWCADRVSVLWGCFRQ